MPQSDTSHPLGVQIFPFRELTPTRVFFDLGRIEMYDGRDDHGEDRWATIGYADPAVLFVVYTVRDEETIRIISARKAVPNEQKQYREANS